MIETRTTELAYLVRVDERFLVDVSGGEIQVTDVPSHAKHTDYTTADQAAQRLRRRGFKQAVVTTHLGVPVSANHLQWIVQQEIAKAQARAMPRAKLISA